MAERIWDQDAKLREQAEALRQQHRRGKGNGEDQPKPLTKEHADELVKERQSFAAEIAKLALVRLRDEIAYPIELRAVMKRSGFGKRDIERAVKPAYEALLADEAARLGDSAAPGQRDQVLEIGLACELFCDADRVAYATIDRAGHRETWPVSSKRFREHVLGEFKRQHGRLAAGTALGEGIEAVAAAAVTDGPVRDVFVRLGEAGGKIYLDLCREDWKVVEIDAQGWRMLDGSPVPFLRTANQRPLPIPSRERGGIARLRSLINIESDDDWILHVSFLGACLRPRGPYPIEILNGEPGAAKSSAMRRARQLIDPAEVLIASPPKDEEDLVVVAKHNRLLPFDNLSSISSELADALCRVATGGGINKRKRFTDLEQSSISVRRPVMLSGITELTARADFAERTIVLVLPEMPDELRRSEEELDAEFDAVAPAILGALLDGVAAGLDNRRAVDSAMKPKPRMADFAVWGAAMAPAFGWTGERFLDAYAHNRLVRAERIVEANVVARTLYEMTKEETFKGWSGTATQLQQELDNRLPEALRRSKDWPKDPTRLSRRLTGIARMLRAVGVTVGKSRSADRILEVQKIAPVAP
jgi:putative DNA primase/helicase